MPKSSRPTHPTGTPGHRFQGLLRAPLRQTPDPTPHPPCLTRTPSASNFSTTCTPRTRERLNHSHCTGPASPSSPLGPARLEQSHYLGPARSRGPAAPDPGPSLSSPRPTVSNNRRALPEAPRPTRSAAPETVSSTRTPARHGLQQLHRLDPARSRTAPAGPGTVTSTRNPRPGTQQPTAWARHGHEHPQPPARASPPGPTVSNNPPRPARGAAPSPQPRVRDGLEHLQFLARHGLQQPHRLGPARSRELQPRHLQSLARGSRRAAEPWRQGRDQPEARVRDGVEHLRALRLGSTSATLQALARATRGARAESRR